MSLSVRAHSGVSAPCRQPRPSRLNGFSSTPRARQGNHCVTHRDSRLPPLLHSLLARAGSSAWLLLLLTTLFWGGNVPAARLAVGEVSPMVIVAGRWAIACVILYLFLPAHVRAEWRKLLPHWRWIAFMGATLTISNALIFMAAVHTSGLNLAILQGVTPVLVIIGAWVAWRTPVGAVRWAGLAVSLFGVALVATQGQPMSLARTSVNIGDVLQFFSSSLYAVYALALRNKPAGSAWTLFALISVMSFATSLPLLAVEYAQGGMILPGSWRGVLALVYIAIFTSLLGQLFFMRGVELVGPGRAAMFHNLTPVFGAILSILVLGETLHAYHAIALTLVLGGILMCERFGRR
jgi:drug/metabolite transporter (DMT)-like permease